VFGGGLPSILVGDGSWLLMIVFPFEFTYLSQTNLPFFLEVLGLELRAFTLSHFTSPIFVKGFSR
jgi:hypothetical protein